MKNNSEPPNKKLASMRTASPQEMKRVAKKVAETMQIYFNSHQDMITRVVSRATNEEVFNVYEMVRNIPSEETLWHTINLCLTAIFAAAFSQCSIPSRHFEISEMEKLVALEFQELAGEAKNEQ